MKALIVYEETDPRKRNGGTIRTDGLVAGLCDNEVGLEVHRLGVRPGGPGANLLTRHLRTRLGRVEVDAVIIQGLQLWPLVRGLDAALVIWDVCDSWLLKNESMQGRGGLARRAKTVAAYAAIKGGNRPAALRTYIADQDKSRDDQALHATNSMVVPNGTEIGVSARAGARTSILADWTYPPNQRGLQWLMSAGRLPCSVHLYGIASASMCGEGLVPEGFVDTLQEIYDESALILAPVIDGAGMKNKVLEGLCAGLPTITTTHGVAGIEEIPPWCLIADTPRDFNRAIAQEIANPRVPEAALLEAFRARHSWRRATSELATLLPRGRA